MNSLLKGTVRIILTDKEMEAYYTADYSIEDLKVIADYFGRPIATEIYNKKVSDEVKAEMKRIFLEKENGEHLKCGAPKEAIKAIRKEI